MKIGIYCVGDAKLDGYRWIGSIATQVAKRSMPGIEVVHFTDNDSNAIEGVDRVVRMERNCPMAVHRMRHHQTPGTWLFIDTDVLILADVSDVFKHQFDIAISSRVGNDGTMTAHWAEMPHNMGVVFSRSPEFWAAAEAELLTYPLEKQRWMGDQLAVCRLIKRGEVNAKILPGEIYNCPPEFNKNASIVHYKGERKQMMIYDAEKLLEVA